MTVKNQNECAGRVEKVGRNVKNFHVGDRVYTRLPIKKIGAFAEYVAVDCEALANNEALIMMANGKLNGKVIIQM